MAYLKEQERLSLADVFNSRLVLLLGRLPTVVDGQGGGWGYVTLLAKEAGVKFISIDPRYTVDAQAHGAQWIPIKPGTDLALILALWLMSSSSRSSIISLSLISG